MAKYLKKYDKLRFNLYTKRKICVKIIIEKSLATIF